MFFEDDNYYAYECEKCDEKDNQLSDIKYWLLYLIEQLYSSDPLNINECERTLEELCAVVKVNLPARDIAIERKSYFPTQISYLQDWQTFNKQYLKELTNQ